MTDVHFAILKIFYGSNGCMFVGRILGLLILFTDGIMIDSDVGFILRSTDRDVLGPKSWVPDGFIARIDDGSVLGSLFG